MDLYDNPNLKWERYIGDPDKQREEFNWPIDYSGTILDIREDGVVEALYRWAPNSYCHFHRHVAPTTSLVLQGELHVTDIVGGKKKKMTIRRPGDWSHKSETEDHMEMGGAEGALVLFFIKSENGALTQQLNGNGEVLRTITIDDLKKKREALI